VTRKVCEKFHVFGEGDKSDGLGGYLEDYLLLVVDATEMPADFREDFFMTSGDRAVDTEDREFVDNGIVVKGRCVPG
jgi:hypothetical protein